jgi:hypothetical protein
LLFGCDTLDEAGDFHSCTVKKEEDVLHDGSEPAVKEGVELLTVGPHQAELVLEIDHLVDSLVNWLRLHFFHSLLSIIKTNVE